MGEHVNVIIKLPSCFTLNKLTQSEEKWGKLIQDNLGWASEESNTYADTRKSRIGASHFTGQIHISTYTSREVRSIKNTTST